MPINAELIIRGKEKQRFVDATYDTELVVEDERIKCRKQRNVNYITGLLSCGSETRFGMSDVTVNGWLLSFPVDKLVNWPFLWLDLLRTDPTM